MLSILIGLVNMSRYHLAVQMQEMVTQIRELPGLSSFLLPSLVSNLQHAANEEPVIVVNASKHNCDSLIVFLDRGVHMPLQITQECVRDPTTELYTLAKNTKSGDMTKQLAIFLRKLWDEIVSSIVDFLQTIRPIHSRMSHCRVLSLLLLHAAASCPYRTRQRKLPDMHISSYTLTLIALIRARCPKPSNLPLAAGGEWCFVAIGQANTVGESELLSVGTELDDIGNHVGSLATFTPIDGEESKESLDEVIQLAAAMEFVRFHPVIGTLSVMDDGETNKITSMF